MPPTASHGHGVRSAPPICEVGGSGVILPLGGDSEQRWPIPVRVILYFLGLGWCFMGVAIIADVFLGAIEKITSKKVRRLNPTTNRYVTRLVWNPTVANLTLMALGSSAPEILLSVIELFGNDFYSGDLGPSTIVGSAAFNLLCIVAVCIYTIPDHDVRKIKEMPVYMVTSTFSVFAYLWLLVILLAISPHVVEIWEGVITFLLFPALVTLAFLADRGYFSSAMPQRNSLLSTETNKEMTKEELAQLEIAVRKQYGTHLTEDQVEKFIQVACAGRTSRAYYRVAATRAMMRGKRVDVTQGHGRRLPRSLSGLATSLKRCTSKAALTRDFTKNLGKVVPCEAEEDVHHDPEAVTFEFSVMRCAVLENAGMVVLTVVRTGAIDSIASVHYCTREGTAKPELDYTHSEGRLIFPSGETKQTISISIVDDQAYEEDEEFFVDLFDPQVDEPSNTRVELGANACITVVIIDDDLPGIISFCEETMHIPEKVCDSVFDIAVQRKNGSTGVVTCKYHSEDDTACAGMDFQELSGTLRFDAGETKAHIKVCIKARGRYESSECFRVILSEPTGGAKFDAESDGGAGSCILTVFVESEKVAKARVDRLMSSLQSNWERAKIGNSNWREQFRGALFVNGGEDTFDNDRDKPSKLDWAMHLITMPWKLLFAFCPPTDYCGGWICFGTSLVMIGIVTAVIGDMAALLGCVIGVPDSVTAITLVALGTSLPDTFASKTAAIQDPYADASIGNVTGSNSVNVFLGLGLPWMIGACYWEGSANAEWNAKYLDDMDIPAQFKDGAFIVKAGNLAFSVSVFSTFAVFCIALLYVRRQLFRGELGGPWLPKCITSAILVCCWLAYVGLSAWYSIKHRK